MPSGIARKWRPPLLLVLGGTLGAVLAAPLLGLAALRALEEALGFGQSAALIGLAVVAVTLILGFLLWRLLLRPIRALAARAESVRDGGPEPAPLDHYGTRELRDLGESVLGMAAALSNRERTIRTFTDHVTHELKTPIAAIRGPAELREGPPAFAQQGPRRVPTILASARRMEEQLTALRRVAAVREPTHRGEARLAEVLPALRAAFPGLELRADGPDVSVPLDRDGLDIVLRHLIGNSAGHGALRVTLSARDGPDLVIVDDGTGIAEGDRPRVFDPFFTTRRETNGTGMGLTIVRNLLQAHGGQIELLPSANGAAFRIRF